MGKNRIWGRNIPGNSDRMKINDMEVHEMSEAALQFGFYKDVFLTDLMGDRRYLDGMTYETEIRKGSVSPRYDDIPTLTPYLLEGSDTAVIVVPGGGFCMASRESEGYAIAEFLNTKGISAFVLDYRLNPYKAPYPYLDVQRAIRYVRFHAAEYGIDPHKIGTIGFSAGGYLIGAAAIFLKDEAAAVPGYTPDEVDAVDGRADFLGMIYPVTNFDENQNMLAILAGDDFFDDQKRMALWKQYSLIDNLEASGVRTPQFFCYGDKDPLKGMNRYDEKLSELGISHETLVLEGAIHGYALNNPKYNVWADRFVDWVKKVTE